MIILLFAISSIISFFSLTTIIPFNKREMLKGTYKKKFKIKTIFGNLQLSSLYKIRRKWWKPKNFRHPFFNWLIFFGFPAHDLTIFTKYLSVWDTNIITAQEQKFMKGIILNFIFSFILIYTSVGKILVYFALDCLLVFKSFDFLNTTE